MPDEYQIEHEEAAFKEADARVDVDAKAEADGSRLAEEVRVIEQTLETPAPALASAEAASEAGKTIRKRRKKAA